MTAGARIAVATILLDGLPADVSLHAVLGEEERERAARFRFVRDREAYVAAHALKRMMVGRAAGTPPRDLVFERGASGKPERAGGGGPHFNLSHCRGLVACAVSGDVAVGIDVEPLDRTVSAGVVGKCLAPAERARLDGLDETDRAAAFLRVWTLKEAYLKGLGVGLSRDPASFSVTIEPPQIVDGTDGWPAMQRTIAARFVLALCWQQGEAAVTVEELSLPELTRSLA